MKHSKVRLTGMVAASAAGEQLLMFVLVNQQNQDVLKMLKTLMLLSIIREKLDEQFLF